MIPFLRLIRFPNLVILALTMIGVRYGLLETLWRHGIRLLLDQGFIPSGMGLHQSTGNFTLLLISTILIAAAGYIINDYFDTKADRINKPEKVFVGRTISRRWALMLHVLLSTAGLLPAIYLAWRCGNLKLSLIPLFSVLALWVYSAKLKKQLLAGNLIIAFLAALVPVLTALFEFNNGAMLSLEIMNLNASETGSTLLKEASVVVVAYALFAFLTNLVREIVKDIEDMEGDEVQGARTLPIVLGETQARYIAMSLVLFSIIILGWILKTLWITELPGLFWYLGAAVMLPMIALLVMLWRAQEKKHYSYASLLCKVVIVTGLFSMFVFRWTF
ncbi:MAG: geranylgeranylglycerol-phosphate geranylgeranyltransferase [Bacteroidia bacterium]|jgi:4-hydroxybenzoate polyprenyltransferase